METVKKVVIDTSAIIAILVNEPIKQILIARTIGADLFAPNSVHWEIGNAFSAMLKRKRITITQIHQAHLSFYPDNPRGQTSCPPYNWL